MHKIIKYAKMTESPVVLESSITVKPVGEPREQTINIEEIKAAENELNKKAEEILADAKLKSEECLRDAEEQARQIKEEAYNEGYKQGYDEGFSQGLQEARLRTEKQINEAAEAASRMLAAANDEAKLAVLSAEREIVAIALAVAQKILCREIAENPMVILPVVKTALEKVRDQEQITVKVNPEDFEMVLQAKHDLQNIVGSEQSLKILADRVIKQGGCIIETSYGTVDARLDSQFDFIKKMLQEAVV